MGSFCHSFHSVMMGVIREIINNSSPEIIKISIGLLYSNSLHCRIGLSLCVLELEWFQIPVQSLTSHGALAILWVLQFPHLYNGDEDVNSSCLTGLLWEYVWIPLSCLAQYLACGNIVNAWAISCSVSREYEERRASLFSTKEFSTLLSGS